MDSTLYHDVITTSPTSGNGYGLALYFAVSAAIVLGGAVAYLWFAIIRERKRGDQERQKLTNDFIRYLKRAAESASNADQAGQGGS